MNRRIRKKIAKRYLDGGGDIRRWVLGMDEYALNGGDYYKTDLIVPTKLMYAIYYEAYRRGWNGVHWDNPLCIEVVDYTDAEQVVVSHPNRLYAYQGLDYIVKRDLTSEIFPRN